jgi:hypothetical protein
MKVMKRNPLSAEAQRFPSGAAGLGFSQFLQETKKPNNPINPVDPV